MKNVQMHCGTARRKTEKNSKVKRKLFYRNAVAKDSK